MLDKGAATSAVRDRVLGRVAELQQSTLVTTAQWTPLIANHSNAAIREVLELANEQGTGADEFLASPEVSGALTLLQTFSSAGGASRPEEELETYRRGVAATGPSLFRAL